MSRRNALDTLSEQAWRNISIDVYANTQRVYQRERALDNAIARGAHPGHPTNCGACRPESRSRHAVVWSQVMGTA